MSLLSPSFSANGVGHARDLASSGNVACAIQDIVKKAGESVKGRADAGQAVAAFAKRLEDARAEAQELERGPVPDQEASAASSSGYERAEALSAPEHGTEASSPTVSNVKRDARSSQAPGDADTVAKSPSEDEHLVSRRPNSIERHGAAVKGRKGRAHSGHLAAATAGRLAVVNELRSLHEGRGLPQ
jgi:hypothetical protein